MTTPKQSKDVDSSNCSNCCKATVTTGGDNREGTRYYICSKCNNACDLTVNPSLLREQIREALISQHTDPNYAEWDTIIDHDVDQIISLVTTYIEKAGIDARLSELQRQFQYEDTEDGYRLRRMARLQAQKAVLEEK